MGIKGFLILEILNSKKLPIPLTEEAQKEHERFLDELQRQTERVKQIPLTVLIWGPSEDTSNPVAEKRVNIRNHLREIGHNAQFSERLSNEECFKDLSEKSKEFIQAQSSHLIIVLLEGSPGALAESHDFCNHPELAGKFYIMIPDSYKDGYSGKGAIKDLSDGYGGVYWYQEGEIASCKVLNMAAKRVEARRNIMYRHRSNGVPK